MKPKQNYKDNTQENLLQDRLYMSFFNDGNEKKWQNVTQKNQSYLMPKIIQKKDRFNKFDPLANLSISKGKVNMIPKSLQKLNQTLIKPKDKNNYSLMKVNKTIMNQSNIQFDQSTVMFDEPLFDNTKQDLFNQSYVMPNKPKKKKNKFDDLSLQDFLKLLKEDPSMQQEFVYLNKKSHAYDYKIVEFQDRNIKEYMTVSLRGITQYQLGVGEFIKIDDWQKEAKQYDKVIKIQFFNEYKKWKIFYIWNKCTRRSHMNKCQKILVNNLYMLDPQLNGGLSQIKDLSYQQTNIQFSVLDIDSSLNYLDFIELQKQHRENQMIYQFLLLETQIKDTLTKSCRGSLNAFKNKYRIPHNDDEEKQPLLIGDESKKDMPYTQEATVKTHLKRLRKFIRLVDFINKTFKVDMIKEQLCHITKLLNEFKTEQGIQKQSNWIICDLDVEGIELRFTPDQSQTKKIFQDILNLGIKAICDRDQQFSQRPELKPYQDQILQSDNIQDLNTIIQNDKQTQILTYYYYQSVDRAISVLGVYKNEIEPFMQLYQENINYKPFSNDIDIDNFIEKIQKYQDQDQQFNYIESNIEIGMFQLNAFNLRELIKNCAKDCLEHIYTQLPEILDYQTEEFLKVTTEINTKLNLTIHESSNAFVEYFVNYCEHVTQANSMLNQKLKELDNINQLMKLIQEYKIKFFESKRQRVVYANNTMSNMTIKIEEAQAEYDQNISKCGKKLERLCPDLIDKIRKLDERLNNPILEDIKQDINKVVDYLIELQIDIQEMIELTNKTNRFQQALGFDLTNFEKIFIIENEYNKIEKLWLGRRDYYKFFDINNNIQFKKLDFFGMESFLLQAKNISQVCQKELEQNEVSKVYKDEISDLQIYIETLRPLLDPSINEPQWVKIRLYAESVLPDSEPFKDINDPIYTFKFIYSSELIELRERFQEIAQQSSKEIELNKQLDNLELFWTEASINIVPYKNQPENFVFDQNEDMIDRLDDTILTLNNILANRYVDGVRNRVETQMKSFMQLQEMLDEWKIHQANYLHLEPILNTNASQLGLQKESSQFKKAEKQYKTLIRRAKDYPECKNWNDDIQNRQNFQMLRQNNKLFEQIQKALDDFLEKKRELFQRFQFLSNLELLNVISQAKEVKHMIPHLKKIFENIVDLQLDDEEVVGLEMISNEGERVQLKNCSMRGGEVEEWMHTVEDSMRNSIRSNTRLAIIAYENDARKDWIIKFCCQITLCVDAIFWTRMAEEQYLFPEVLDPDDEDNDYGKLDEFIIRIILDLDDAINLIRSNIEKIQRTNLIALVTQDVHYRDIIQYMYEEQIHKQSNFYWIQQMKFYWKDEDFFAKMVTSTLSYGYEFLGSFSRLVITPLTDRCWTTITNAFHQKLGANPAGPAGTGKTESCKDLAKVLGKFCIVFNCSDQINVKMMEKLFIGIGSTGTWVCLDEFNRIDIEVLSVVASQFLQIREALLQQIQSFNFFGKNLILNQNMGVFITFNPGYVGRTELPENLKVLFRPVSMMVPDYTLIAENILYSDGFTHAKDLALKIQMLYKLLSEQLSQQDHYDFGMRSVKSVLAMAGQLKRADKFCQDSTLMMRALCDSNIPKFTNQDRAIFMAIMNDLFPGQQFVQMQNKLLNDEIENIFKQNKRSVNPELIQKINQFNDLIQVRFGLMVVGASNSGKSTIINTLKQANNNITIFNPDTEYFFKIQSSCFNPKSIDISELYGSFDPQTQIWYDGIASKLLRQYTVNLQPKTKYWVIFDGPVDSFWIENMNTVLDDSMLLCLANGERIKLHTNMRIIFEVYNLGNASPATISRCGMIFVQQDIIKHMDFINTYFNQQEISPQHAKYFVDNLQIIIPKVFEFLENQKEPINVGQLELIQKLLNIFDFFFQDKFFKRSLNSATQLNIQKAQQKILTYCIYQGLGTHLDDESQLQFNKFIATLFPNQDFSKIQMSDVYISFESRQDGEFMQFQDKLKPFECNKDANYFDIIVLSKEILAYQYILQQYIKIKKHIFITGASGTGKTIIVDSCLSQYTNLCDIRISFSSQTNGKTIQEAVEYKLSQKRNRGQIILTPAPGKEILILIDDVNMPKIDASGSQPPIELLRQIVDLNGLYDRVGLFFKEIDSFTCVNIATHPGGGRAQMTQRYTRHFSIFNLIQTSQETLESIFGQILKGFLKLNKFKPDIVDQTNSIVKTTLILFQMVLKEFKPTDTKYHYIFSLRDVSKVFQGLILSSSIMITSKISFNLLWGHECLRLFHDKLSSVKDQTTLINMIQQLMLQYLNQKVENLDSTFFCDFLRKNQSSGQKYYEMCQDITKIISAVQDVQEDSGQIKLVLFEACIRYLVRICRIFKIQKGNMILVGVGGCGKKSLCQLSALIVDARLAKIELIKKYNMKDFKKDLQDCILEAVFENKQILFSLTDAEIFQEEQLEILNNLLSVDDLSIIVNPSEYEEILAKLIPEALPQNLTSAQLIRKKIITNFHIILSFTPIGPTLKDYMRKYPAFVSSCNTNWILPWPDEALQSVASMFMEEIKMSNVTPQIKESLCNLCVFVESSIQKSCNNFYKVLQRKVYATPKNYIDFVEYYKDLILKLKENITQVKNKLTNGLSKLHDANQTISQLKAKLIELQPVLVQKTTQIKELIQKLTQDQLQANMAKKVVEAEANEINIQSEKILILKSEADIIFKEAQPILQNATEQLDKLTRGEIGEIKQNNNPHALVKYCMECIALLFEEKQEWDHIKKVILSDANLLSKLKNYKGENMAPNVKEKLKKKLQANPSFVPNEMKQVSQAAKSLCEWVHAVNNFTDVYKEMIIKKENCKQMDEELAKANKILSSKQKELEEIIAKVQELEKGYADSKQEKETLDSEIKQTEERLHRASQLTEGLAEEQVRWKEQVNDLTQQLEVLIGNTFLAAASVSYYGPFTGNFRDELVNAWIEKLKENKIPFSNVYNIQSTLGNQIEIREWQQKGLSGDSISINNAIIIQNIEMFPLIIDPQHQANKWIKNMESENNIVVTKENNEAFIRKLEESIQLGRPLLIEDFGEHLSSQLETIVCKKFEIINNKKMIKVSEEKILYSDAFKLYMTTKIQNPHFSPEVFNKVKIINFSVTQEGLKEQLLADVLQNELPEEEKIRRELMVSVAEDRLLLKKGEDRILDLLTNSKGMILDDIELIESLKISKEIAKAVSDKIIVSEKKQEELLKGMELYSDVAVRGVIIYFVITELSLIDPMYQFSLNYFSKLFNHILTETVASDGDRIEILKNCITDTIFKIICRGLFNRHKKIFSFLLCAQIQIQDTKTVDKMEFQFIVQGITPGKNDMAIPPEACFSEQCWSKLNVIQKVIPAYIEIARHIKNNIQQWNEYILSDTINQDIPPMEITPIQQLMLINIFRFEKTIFAIDNFIEQSIGYQYVQIPNVSMEEVYKDLNYQTPLIFILSSGSDPLQLIMKMMKEIGLTSEFVCLISLGQGQGPIADNAINNAIKSGGWVVLQNCHLGKSYMPTLEKKIEVVQLQESQGEINTEFRLFLTSNPCDYFPISVLQNSMKITFEPPQGLKNNLLQSFQDFGLDTFDIAEEKKDNFRKLIFCVSLFHGVVQERRKFGSIGFNIFYQFNSSDLDAALSSLKTVLEYFDYIAWDALKHLIGSINYGGRITDEFDRKCLLSVLNKFCNEDALKDEHEFSAHIKQPVASDLFDLIDYIQNLNLDENPEIYGLHSNANLNYQRNLSQQILETTFAIQPKDNNAQQNQKQEDQLNESIKHFQKFLPEIFIISSDINIQDSLEVFLYQELQKFNILINVINQSLIDFKRVQRGEILISPILDELRKSIILNRVPQLWKNNAYLSLYTLTQWFDDFLKRYKFFSQWKQQQPKSFWLSAFFFPQGFLTGIMQNYARKNKKPIDQVRFKQNLLMLFEIDQISGQPLDGLYVHGLYSEGFRYEIMMQKLNMETSLPGVLFNNLPILHFQPYFILSSKEDKSYEIPIYKTIDRVGVTQTTGQSNNYIISVKLPHTFTADFWTMQGSAIFCQIPL